MPRNNYQIQRYGRYGYGGAAAALYQGGRMAYNYRNQIWNTGQRINNGFQVARQRLQQYRSTYKRPVRQQQQQRRNVSQQNWGGMNNRNAAASKIQGWFRRRRQNKYNSMAKNSMMFKNKVTRVINDMIPWKAASSEIGKKTSIPTGGVSTYIGFTSGITTTNEGNQSWLNGGGTAVSDIDYLLYELLDLDSMNDPALRNFRVEINNMSMMLEINNCSNSTIYVAAYWGYPRTAESTSGYIGIGPAWGNTALSSSYDNLTMTHGITPFDSTSFCSRWKITKSQTYKMASGDLKTLKLPNPMFKNKVYNTQFLLDEAAKPKFTRGLLLIIKGIPVHSTTDHTTVTSGPGAVNIIVKQRMKARLISKDVNYMNTRTQLPTTSASTLEVPVGDTNPPAVYTN